MVLAAYAMRGTERGYAAMQAHKDWEKKMLRKNQQRVLLLCYALSSTGLRYTAMPSPVLTQPIRCTKFGGGPTAAAAGTTHPIALRLRYALSGADMAYAATCSLRAVRY
eukprot:1699229-Rhodomonas_salina.3